MHHGGVVAAAELLADLRQRQVGQLAAQVHGDLAGRHQDPGPGRAAEVVDRQPEVRGRLAHDGRGGDLRPLRLRDQILEHDLGQLEVDGLAVEAGEGGHPDERALELTDVGGDPARDVLQCLRRRVEPLLDRLLAQDRDAGLQLRRLDVGEQAPFEPAPQPVFERHQALGRAVAGDDDLLAGVVQRVEGVEELLLRPFLVLQELDVVDQQHVHVAVAAAEPVLLAVPDHVDEVVGELLRADVPHLDARGRGSARNARSRAAGGSCPGRSRRR